jgi:tetratricopeptide (TPR) repeat protein
VIRQALAAHPDDRDVLWLAARLGLLERKVTEALRTYEAVLAKDADPPARLLQETAAACVLAGEPRKAEPLFRRALEKDPALPEAEEHLRRALVLAPGLAPAQKALEDLALQKAGSPKP